MDGGDNWFPLFSQLYELKQSCDVLLKRDHCEPICNLSSEVKEFLYCLNSCFTYGLIDEDEDAILRVYRDVLTQEVSYEAASAAVLEGNDNSLSCQLGWLCFFLNNRLVFNVVQMISSDEEIHSYYANSFFTNSKGTTSFVNLIHSLDELTFDLPLSVEDPYVSDSEAEQDRPGLFSYLFGSFFFGINKSVDYLDGYVDGVLTPSSTKQVSSGSDSSVPSVSFLTWLRSDSKEHSNEPILCVPQILTSSIHTLQLVWTTQDIHSLSYDSSSVNDTIEYFKSHNRFSDDISGVSLLNVILYTIETLPDPLLPIQHYESILNAMLLSDQDMKIHLLNTFLTDLNDISKVLVDRVITCLSQLIITYSNNSDFVETVHTFCHYITPSFFKYRLGHTMEEGETKACEEVIQLLLLHSPEILINIHKDIDTMNMLVMDKKMRIREICSLLNQSVTCNSNSLSLKLLTRLWNHSVKLYHQMEGVEGPSYSPVSPFWKMIGFQRENPLTDFRGGGILSLIHLLAFVERYPLFVVSLMRDENELKLPLAIACINLSLLLVKTLDLYSLVDVNDVTILSTKPIWLLSSQASFLNEMFICLATETFSLFKPGEPYFLQFTPLLQEVAVILQKTIQEGVGSVEEFCTVMKKRISALRNANDSQLEIHSREEDYFVWLQKRFDNAPEYIEVEKSVAEIVDDSSNEKDINENEDSQVSQEVVPESESESEAQDSQDSQDRLSDSLIDGTPGIHIKQLTITPAVSLSIVHSIQSKMSDVYNLSSYNWNLVYRSSATHHSLHSFLEVARGVSNTLLIVADMNGEIIGSYQEEAWRYSTSFHGNANCCVFGMTGEELSVYPCSRMNSFYHLSNDNVLAIGGGNRHAILLTKDLRHCSTGNCTTFKSPTLSYLCDFECAVVELWRIVK